ncbi:hypothetical protein HQO24_10555 [Rhodococcus fascians]|nr:hypothetical protein [Rhodococcus fascians]MBY4396879.1 hypothetical protein [Rhodococcus fascians]MBY4407358.1 hypothetical protein [Rhodococcus fascians]MBY4421513.1 hypothetical protein [Rhodococcus fascians]MBY4460734.1 hypothetical protein [Rhodococcus fascians]
MSKLAQNYPTIRKLIYAVVVLVCGGLVIAGIITEAQSAVYLAYIGSGLGALAAILASVNVSPPVVTLEPSEYEIGPAVDPAEIARQVAAQLNYGVTQGRAVIDTATASVADARRQVEQAFGEFQGR